MTWLQRIMIHVSLEPLKRKESKYDYDRTDEAVSNISVHSVLDDPHRAFCAHMRSDLLLDAIRQMTPEERTAFFATENEMIGLTYEQAAEQLNWTIETVKSRVSSARRRVRTSIPKEWVP
ncbi:MAG: hypothetical protein AMXMBFR19_09280 [Chthonomonadaceae bacterium]|uniref:RNA polymerase sigma factor 70 region 4 type 2 domain-containing protein n=1 Tax=Candidatus Nitrosymbiomonas proteolyticus TaxID=2608984 RepID=A0A809S5N6_9BACT|nr:hypothetical protein NPRO_19620 [Candidatus Nitrosymbiomonas proteolyticus]